MIDLHTHTFASDGVLLHSEIIRRAFVAGYRAIGITDHADETNMEDLILRAVKAAEVWGTHSDMVVIPGVEITHVNPDSIGPLAARAKELGAKIVVVHGETITEPVAAGTNSEAVRSPDVDILAHPGLIKREDAIQAGKNGVLLEITSRKGHSAANGHVAAIARDVGAQTILNSDAHAPGDLITQQWGNTILSAAGLTDGEVIETLHNSENLLNKILETQ
jgi:histidinol phosphatase-like PHP family hydrolase